MALIDTHFKELKDQGASDLHMVIGFPPLTPPQRGLGPHRASGAHTRIKPRDPL